VDVALAGHDHDYERFSRMNPAGDIDSEGILSFVSGAGGKSLYHLGTRKKGSVVFDAKRAGVLVMRLGDGTFSWRYRTIDGRTPDRGERRCR
jgi:alkaline phosphatase